jgi:hypothetical protein
MLSWFLNVIKTAFRIAIQTAMFPVFLLADLLGGRSVPPPPPPPLPVDDGPGLPDPSLRWAREVNRWARRRMQGREYVPDVPEEVAAWLATLDEPRIVRLASLRVSAIHNLLNSRPAPDPDQSSSSRSASASASSRSARIARSRQYSAADRQFHSH